MQIIGLNRKLGHPSRFEIIQVLNSKGHRSQALDKVPTTNIKHSEANFSKNELRNLKQTFNILETQRFVFTTHSTTISSTSSTIIIVIHIWIFFHISPSLFLSLSRKSKNSSTSEFRALTTLYWTVSGRVGGENSYTFEGVEANLCWAMTSNIVGRKLNEIMLLLFIPHFSTLISHPLNDFLLFSFITTKARHCYIEAEWRQRSFYCVSIPPWSRSCVRMRNMKHLNLSVELSRMRSFEIDFSRWLILSINLIQFFLLFLLLILLTYSDYILYSIFPLSLILIQSKSFSLCLHWEYPEFMISIWNVFNQ